MCDDAFEASGRALFAALRRSSCSGTEQHLQQARLRTAAARDTAATQSATAIDLGEISLGEIVLGEIKISLDDNRHGRLEPKRTSLGEVSLQETTAITLAAMP